MEIIKSDKYETVFLDSMSSLATSAQEWKSSVMLI